MFRVKASEIQSRIPVTAAILTIALIMAFASATRQSTRSSKSTDCSELG